MWQMTDGGVGNGLPGGGETVIAGLVDDTGTVIGLPGDDVAVFVSQKRDDGD